MELILRTDDDAADAIIVEGDIPSKATRESSSTGLDRIDSESTTDDKRSEPRRAGNQEVALFFLCGIGSTIGWTAVLSNLVFYSEILGKASYVILNMAVYFPMLPITIAQARWDSYFDREYNSLFTFSVRGSFGFSVSTIALLFMPLVSRNLISLSILTTVLGTASAVLHGTCKQMASFVYPNCKRLPAAVTSGMQASAVLVLVASLSTGFGSSGDAKGITEFYVAVAAFVVLCWASFGLLISHSSDVLESMKRRDSSFRGFTAPLLSRTSTNESFGSVEMQEDAPPVLDDIAESELSYGELWKMTWRSCLSITITVASSMSVASWFNQISSANPNNQSLPQVLFYARLFADLLGRPATLVIKPTSLRCIGIVSWLRVLLFVPLFFVYEHILPKSDVAITLGVAVFSFLSGYIATACYQLAPDLLRGEERDSMPKQASLINVCFSASIILGLTVSFILLGLGI